MGTGQHENDEPRRYQLLLASRDRQLDQPDSKSRTFSVATNAAIANELTQSAIAMRLAATHSAVKINSDGWAS
jgi:hypothetical protein